MIFDLDDKCGIWRESTALPEYEEEPCFSPPPEPECSSTSPPVIPLSPSRDRKVSISVNTSPSHRRLHTSSSTESCGLSAENKVSFSSGERKVSSTTSGGYSRSTSNHSLTSCEAVRDRLLLAKQEARWRELRLRVPTVVVGVSFALAAFVLIIVPSRYSLLYVFGAWLFAFGVYVGFLGLLPSDRRAVPLVGACVLFPAPLMIAFAYVRQIWDFFQLLFQGDCAGDGDTPCWVVVVMLVARCIDSFALIFMSFKTALALKRRTPSQILLPFFLTGWGYLLLVIGSISLPRGVATFVAGQSTTSAAILLVGVPFFAVGVLILVAPGLRMWLQSWFLSRGGAAVAAAGVAQLLGGKEINEVLASARNTFCYVRADRVARSDMEDNCPNPALSKLSKKGHLGNVDAFISHSWHDDADAKWTALQELRKKFKEDNGREPKLWIDKYCINQNDIAMSLACLPVYMSGCNELWIICGSTYLQRLWCVMEILIFIEMGGSLSNLRVKLLGKFASEKSDQFSSELGMKAKSSQRSWKLSSSLMVNLEAFDPRKATCSNADDTERLQAVLQATGCDRITELVRNVFTGGSQDADDGEV